MRRKWRCIFSHLSAPRILGYVSVIRAVTYHNPVETATGTWTCSGSWSKHASTCPRRLLLNSPSCLQMQETTRWLSRWLVYNVFLCYMQRVFFLLIGDFLCDFWCFLILVGTGEPPPYCNKIPTKKKLGHPPTSFGQNPNFYQFFKASLRRLQMFPKYWHCQNWTDPLP